MMVGPFSATNPIWPGMPTVDGQPSSSMMMHPGNGNLHAMNALLNSMSNPSFPCMPSMNPWISNQNTMMQMLGGNLNHYADQHTSIGSTAEPRAFVPMKPTAPKNSEFGQKHEVASWPKQRPVATDSSGSAAKVDP